MSSIRLLVLIFIDCPRQCSGKLGQSVSCLSSATTLNQADGDAARAPCQAATTQALKEVCIPVEHKSAKPVECSGYITARGDYGLVFKDRSHEAEPEKNENDSRYEQRRCSWCNHVMRPNDAHHWRRANDVGIGNKTESRRPVHVPG